MQESKAVPLVFAGAFSLCIAACGAQSNNTAQTHVVETIELTDELVSWGGVGGVSVDQSGNIILANFNNHVWRISPDGAVQLITDQLSYASGNTILANGAILQADFGQNLIMVLDPEKGVAETISNAGLNGPVGLDEAENGDIFVANYEGGYIARIPKDGGPAEKFAEHSKMTSPNGLIIDELGDIYVADLESPIIFKVIPDGSVEEFAELPGEGNGHIAIADGALFVTQLLNHRIVRLEFAGTQTVVAGNGTAGAKDGASDISALDHPNGIAADNANARLYFNGHRGVMEGGERGSIALRKLTIRAPS